MHIFNQEQPLKFRASGHAMSDLVVTAVCDTLHTCKSGLQTAPTS
jgi:hypothetical protein